MDRPLRLLLIVLVVIRLLGLLPTWPYSRGWGYGYYPSGGLGLLLIILIVLFVASGNAKLPK